MMNDSFDCYRGGCCSRTQKSSIIFKLESHSGETCNHRICTECFSLANVKRKCNPYIECPVCKAKVFEWTLLDKVLPSGMRTRRSAKRICVPIEEEIIRHSIPVPSIEENPKEYHKSLGSKTIAMLSLTSINKDGNIGTTAARLQTMKSPDEWGEGDKKQIEIIFQILNTILIPNREEDNGTDDIEAYLNSESDLDQETNEGKNSSLLHKCIYALGTGETMGTSDMKSNLTQLWRNQRMQAFAASDIIRRMRSRKAGRLKKFIGRQLMASAGVPDGFWKVLTRLGIAPSIEQERLRSIEKVHAEILKGLPAKDPHDLWLLLFDNVGFRKQKGYDQYTAMQWVRVTKEILIKWGIYPKEGETMDGFPFQHVQGHPLQHMSYSDLFKRKKWEDIREGEDFEDILGINDAETEIFAGSIIHAVSMLLSNFDLLPSLDKAKEMLRDMKASTESRYKKFQMAERKEQDEVARTLDDDGNIEAENSRRVSFYCKLDDTDIEGGKDKYSSHYERNDAYIDRPVQLDLNCTRTCLFLMNYADEHRKHVTSLDPEGDHWRTVPKVMDKVPIPLCCDGNPSHMISNLIKTNPEYRGKVMGVAGGFHNMLEAHRKRGDVFQETHLKDFFWNWRPSDGQISWVMNPGDPNQISSELPMYTMGLYAAAIQALLEKKSRSVADTNKIHASVSDVIDLMLARAKEWPIVFMVLMELRFAELTFLLEQSKKTGDVEMFLTATKFNARLFAASNATKYVSMIQELLVEWHCCSPAEKIIFANAIFTRRTKHGELIFTDRFVEWMVRDFRSWLGSTGNKYTESIFERVALTLVERMKARNLQRNVSKARSAGKKEGKGRSNDFEIDAIFLESFVLACELNLFGEGPPHHMNSRRNSNGRGETADQRKKWFPSEYTEKEFSCFFAPNGKQTHLNKTLLKLYSIGDERLREYFDIYLKRGDLNDPYRGKDAEEYVSLKKIPTFSKDVQDEIDFKKKRCYSVEIKALQTHTNNELVQEILSLNNLFEDLELDGETENPSRNKKDDNIGTLITLRKRLRRRDPAAWEVYKTNQNQMIEAENPDIDLTNEDVANVITEELEHSFFNLGEFRSSAAATKNYSFHATKYRAEESTMDINANDDEGSCESHGETEIHFDDESGDENATPLNQQRQTNERRDENATPLNQRRQTNYFGLGALLFL